MATVDSKAFLKGGEFLIREVEADEVFIPEEFKFCSYLYITFYEGHYNLVAAVFGVLIGIVNKDMKTKQRVDLRSESVE